MRGLVRVAQEFRRGTETLSLRNARAPDAVPLSGGMKVWQCTACRHSGLGIFEPNGERGASCAAFPGRPEHLHP